MVLKTAKIKLPGPEKHPPKSSSWEKFVLFKNQYETPVIKVLIGEVAMWYHRRDGPGQEGKCPHQNANRVSAIPGKGNASPIVK